jgi:hypothetical protein
MILHTYQYDITQLNLSVQQIEKVIGIGTDESSGMISDLISRALEDAASICSIKAGYSIFHNAIFDASAKSVKINDIDFNINKIVYHQIKKSSSVAVFICTAGHEIGIRSKHAMKEGDLLRGYLFDIIGTEIVEAATNLMQNDLELEVKQSGKRITNRYSPGYCGWDVSEQYKLFRLIGDNSCGITLNQSALMDPIKSVSGFIGVGENVKFNPYTCNLCDMKDCIYRSKRNKAEVTK